MCSFNFTQTMKYRRLYQQLEIFPGGVTPSALYAGQLRLSGRLPRRLTCHLSPTPIAVHLTAHLSPTPTAVRLTDHLSPTPAAVHLTDHLSPTPTAAPPLDRRHV